MSTENKEVKEVKEVVAPRTQPVTISAVKQMLKDGKSRKEIGKEFGLNHKQLVSLFQNPKLKGLKTHTKTELPFELIDDETNATEDSASKDTKGAKDAAVSEDSKQDKKAVVTEEAATQGEGW